MLTLVWLALRRLREVDAPVCLRRPVFVVCNDTMVENPVIDGVSIVLLSQGISEYNQGTFDFSQECETAFLLPINDLTNVKAISKFLGLSASDCTKAMRNIEKLDNGLCVSNVKELHRAELFEIAQYWKETSAS